MANLVFFCLFSTELGILLSHRVNTIAVFLSLGCTGTHWQLWLGTVYPFLISFVWDSLSDGSGAFPTGMTHTLILGRSGPLDVFPGLCCWNFPFTNHRYPGVPRRALDISHILLIRPCILAIQLPLIVTFHVSTPQRSLIFGHCLRGMRIQCSLWGSLNVHFRGVSKVMCWKHFSTCWS